MNATILEARLLAHWRCVRRGDIEVYQDGRELRVSGPRLWDAMRLISKHCPRLAYAGLEHTEAGDIACYALLLF